MTLKQVAKMLGVKEPEQKVVVRDNIEIPLVNGKLAGNKYVTVVLCDKEQKQKGGAR